MPDTPPFVRDDVKALLDMLQQLGGTPLENSDLAEGRAAYLALRPLVEADPQELAVIKDISCPGPDGDIPLRLYDLRETREAGPVIMFYHGGGFVIGNLESHHALCTEIAAIMDLPVIAVDYRLAPEAPFPAAPDDCEAATRWVAASPPVLDRTITGLIPLGVSAGGNLAIVTSNSLARQPAHTPVIMQVPIYPVVSDITDDLSRNQFAEGYLLTASTMDWFQAQYAGDPGDIRNFPLLDPKPARVPTVLSTAGLDPLRDSGRKYAAKLIDLGTDVSYLEFHGNIHEFANLRKAIPSAQKDLEAVMQTMKNMLERHAG